MQGLSLDEADVDLGSSVSEAGQAYVALSRLRTMDPRVVAFYDGL